MKSETKLDQSGRLPLGLRMSERAIFVLLFLLSILFITVGIPLGIELPADAQGRAFDPNGPRFLAYISGGMVLVLALVGLIKDGLSRQRVPNQLKPVSQFLLREFVALGCLALSLPLSVHAGLPLAGGFVGIGLLLLAGVREAIYFGLIGVVAPASVWAFFAFALKVPVPLFAF